LTAFLYRGALAAEHIDATAAAAGWGIAIVGFSLTLWQLRQTQSSADAAKRAAKGVEDAVHKYDTITEIANADAALNSCVDHHRNREWPAVHDQYARVKRAYTNIGAMHSGLTPEQADLLKADFEQISTMDNEVERHLAGEKPPDIATFNIIIFKHLDDLSAVSAAIRKTLGGEANG
jgi:hypothetical protein